MAKSRVHFDPDLMVDGSSTSSSGIEMDRDLANRLFDTGANLILLDFPVGTEFGIDMNVWNTGAKFKGVKMIPPGLHFVFYSAVSKEGQTAPRTGFFHDFTRGELVAKRYNSREEDVEDVTSEEKERLRTNIRDIDRNLGAYPYDSWKKWVSLTNRISPSTLSRLEPMTGKIQSVTELIPDAHFTSKEHPELNISSASGECQSSNPIPSKRQSQSEMEEEKLPKMHYKPGTEIRYTSLPTERFPKGSTPSEISKHSMDSSYQLETYLLSFRRMYGDQVSSSMAHLNQMEEVLAELQFCFVCFLVGQHYESFEQWKKLMRLLCSCDCAIEKYSDFYMVLITDLHFQIKEVPDDFFVDIVSCNNFLVSVLTQLFSTIKNNEAIDKKLKARAAKFQSNLSKKFDWNFNIDMDEDAPVIVELESA